MFLALICIFTVSCGDGTKKAAEPAGDDEKSEETDGEEENEEPSDTENANNEENNGTETDDSANSEISDENQEVTDSGEETVTEDDDSGNSEISDENQTVADDENGGGTEENDSEDPDADSPAEPDDEEPEGEGPDEPEPDPVFVAEPSDDFETKTEALIVTTDEFAEVFQKFADFHTVTGINTKVVTIEKICETADCEKYNTKKDPQKAIKKYVSLIEGLKYLILGGDIGDVPSRQIHDYFELTLIGTTIAGPYDENFYSDFYYADFSEWDSNGDGKYADDDNDNTPNLKANVAVGRISVSTVDEAEIYFEKIVKHHTAYNTAHTKKSLLIANIATTLAIGSGVKVNAGYYFEAEGKTASLMPSDYAVKKLYTQSMPYPGSGTAEYLDNDKEKAAIEEGTNLIVHSGHGGPYLLTCEQGTDPDRDFDDDMAYALENDTLPFFLSCACQAGQFVKNDSAGEKLMNAPLGGAIVYLGNTATGLGIAGGSQFIDEMLKNMFNTPSSTIGESYIYAHETMKDSDTFNPTIVNVNVPVVNEDSYQWTKKSIVMLGDPMTVFWRDKFEPFSAEIEPEVEEDEEGGKTVAFHFGSELEGAALRVFADGKLYDVPYIMHETIKINLDSAVETITVGIKAEDSQYFFKEFDI